MSVITLGEVMMRLSTVNHIRLQDSDTLSLNYGGAEMNVAIGLSGLGIATGMLTGVPENVLGDTIRQTLQRYNVSTEGVFQKAGRLGIYFVEEGFGHRPTRLIYDRHQSVFSLSQIEDFKFESVMRGYDWFHFTGITPAINEDMFAVVKTALRIAKENHMKVSCDLNFRSQLWDFQTARQKMSELLNDVDIIFGYEPLSLIDKATGKDMKEGLKRDATLNDLRPILKEIHDTYNITHIAFTQRKIFNSKRNRLQGFLSTSREVVKTAPIDIDILDRVGTGDAFSVGILYGLIQQWSLQDTVNFGLQNMCFKHTVQGDFCFASLSEIQSTIQNGKDINR